MKHTLFFSAAVLALISPAMAQDGDDDVIVVTAQKREQNIKDVPIAVTAYSQDKLDELGVQQFDDLADFVPGLEVQEQSANNPGFVIRGITSDSGEANIEPRISIYQDGVSVSRSRGSFFEVFDSNVEVIRGPQPTLFGRSALIGAINVTSNRPELDEYSGSIRVGAGDYDFNFAEAAVNIPLVEEKAAGRVAFRFKQRDGYVENILGGDDFNGFQTFAARASVTYVPTDALEITLIGNFQTDDNPGTSFKSGTFFPAPGASIAPGEAAALNTFGNIQGGRELGLERELRSVTGLVDYQINDEYSLSSITSFRDFDSSEVFDPDGFGFPLIASVENAEGDLFSQELRLNFEGTNGLSGFVGASYFDENGKQDVDLAVGEVAAQALLGGFLFTDVPGVPQNPVPLAFLPTVNANPASPLFGAPLGVFQEKFINFGDTEAYELFADATYEVNDKLEVTAGIRYSIDEKKTGFAVSSPAPSNLTGAGIFLGTAIFSNGQLVEFEDEFDGFAARLAANYDLSDDITLFANYARGRRPEVIAYDVDETDLSVLVTGQLNPNRFTEIDAEEVDSYEAGLKGQFLDGRVYGDASAYFYEYTNFQTTIINQNAQAVPINAGNATAYGFEATVFAELNDWAEVFAVYAYTDATFDDKDDQGNAQIFGGNRFRLTPENAYTIGGTFTKETQYGSFAFTPIYSWRSETFFDNDNDQQDQLLSGQTYILQDEVQDDFGILDLRLTYTNPENGFGVELFVENATDEEYIIDAGNTGDILGTATFIAGAPRMYGFYISKEF